MCTQRVIWCACGHGEFLQPNRCPLGARVGNCWLVLHGDHRIVVDMECSYCKAGLNTKRPLSSPRPRGALATRIEDNVDEEVFEQDMKSNLVEDADCNNTTEAKPMWEFDDVLNTNFSGEFDLSQELWQYK